MAGKDKISDGKLATILIFILGALVISLSLLCAEQSKTIEEQQEYIDTLNKQWLNEDNYY